MKRTDLVMLLSGVVLVAYASGACGFAAGYGRGFTRGVESMALVFSWKGE